MIVVVVVVLCPNNILVEYEQSAAGSSPAGAAGEGKLHTLYLGEYVSTHLRWVPLNTSPGEV